MTSTSETAAWARIEELLEGVDFTALTLAVVDLTAEQRRATVTPLKAYVRAHSGYQFRLNEAGVAIVGAGVLPSAKVLAAWLQRYMMRFMRTDYVGREQRFTDINVVPNVFYVLTERGVPWLGDLAAAIADRLPRQLGYAVERFDLVQRLLDHVGAPAPITPGFISGWFHGLHWRPDVLGEQLRARPSYAALLTHVFDVEEVGAAIDHDPRWAAALADQVAAGVVDRDEMLDACLTRLERGGKPGASRAFLGVHEALAPTIEEVASRADAYVALLRSTQSTVAAMAQRRLFEAEDRGVLTSATTIEITTAVLGRTEKKLVRSQLARIAARPADTGHNAVLARLIVSSWAGVDADLVRRGLRTIVGMDLPHAQRAEVRAAIPSMLAPDLAGEVIRELGGAPVVRTAEPAEQPRDAASQRQRIDRITNPGDVADATQSLFRTKPSDVTTEQLESVIDGLLTAAAADPGGLRAALAPIWEIDPVRWLRSYYEYSYNRTLWHALLRLTEAAAGETPTEHPTDPHERWAAPEIVLIERIEALSRAGSLPPLSVSLPTWTDGFLDPDALLDRLGRAATAGWQPPQRELELALLRLELPPETAARESLARTFAGLGTDAGRMAARWVRNEFPTPVRIERSVYVEKHTNWDGQVDRETPRLDARIRTETPVAGEGIWSGLVRDRPGAWQAPAELRSPRCWPALAPRHPEVVAARCVQTLATSADHGSELVIVLPALAGVGGQLGEAAALALGYGLCSARPEPRATAQQALVAFCAGDGWDGSLFGQVLGELFVSRSVVTKRAVEPLRAAATTTAGGDALWPAMREAVAALVANPERQPALADVLALAAEIAQRVQAREPIRGLAEFAARPGAGRHRAEARRLLDALSG